MEETMASQGVPRMSPEQLYTRMAQGESVVALDVRTAAAVSFQPDQIPGTRWLPLSAHTQLHLPMMRMRSPRWGR